jgi:PAS domain S-box-containing protein
MHKLSIKKTIKIGESKSLIVNGIIGDKLFEIKHTGIMFQGKKAVLEVFRDITVQKKMEESIIHEKDLAQKYLNIAGSIIVALNKKGDITLLNKSGYEVLEYPKGSLIGRNWFNTCLLAKDKKKVKDFFKKLIDGDKKTIRSVKYFENIVVTRSGKQKIVSWHNTLIKDEFGKTVGLLSSGEDITKKREVERELIKNEEKYRSMFESINDLIVVLDKKGKIVDINGRVLANSLGYSTDQFLGKSLKSLGKIMTKSSLKLVLFNFAKRLAGFKIPSYDIQFITKKGEIRDFEVSATVRKKNGETEGTMAILRDITDKKKFENKLINSEKRFRDISLSMVNWIWETDKDGKYTFVSNGVKKVLGYKPKEVLGKTPFSFMPKDEAKKILLIFKKLVTQKKPIVDLENWNIKKNGEKVLSLTNGIPILDERGKLIGYRGVDQDITSKKQAENEVKKQIDLTHNAKERLEAILENIGDGVFVIDRSYKITMINRVACELCGYLKKDKIIGSYYGDVLKFIYEKNRKVNSDFIERAMGGKLSEMSNHTLLIRKDKTEFPVDDSASPIKDKNGNVVGCVVVFRDVTKERKIDKLKTEFVSVASHQLRTPLTGIKWFLEILLSEKAGKLNAKQKDFIAQIDSSNERMIDLVSDLLSVSRIETGKKFSIVKKKIDIIKVINSVLSDVIALAKERRVKVIGCGVANHQKLMVMADSDHIRQVFNNLITNAIKYSKKGGVVELGCNYGAKKVEFFIKDSGVGIPASQQKQVFDKFFRANNIITKETSGTGLGLYISKAIVNGHGGKIWFKSTENRGTTFYFSIPRK